MFGLPGLHFHSRFTVVALCGENKQSRAGPLKLGSEAHDPFLAGPCRGFRTMEQEADFQKRNVDARPDECACCFACVGSCLGTADLTCFMSQVALTKDADEYVKGHPEIRQLMHDFLVAS